MPKKSIVFSENEINHFLSMITSSVEISILLEHDVCNRLADNYLLALTFIYFKRAHLKPSEYTYIYFFVALLLAHSLVEEDDEVVDEIIKYLLPEPDNKEMRRQMHLVKLTLFEAMEFRGYVSRSSCEKIINAVPHPLWSRQRDETHGGTIQKDLIESQLTPSQYDWYSRSCEKCRRSSLYNH